MIDCASAYPLRQVKTVRYFKALRETVALLEKVRAWAVRHPTQ